VSKRILMVLTSHDDLGGVRKTGFYVPEAAHPYAVFKAHGYRVDFASPKGRQPPMDGFNANDPEQVAFLGDADVKQRLAATLTPAQVSATDYDAIFYVGGHGTMWDFPSNSRLNEIAAQIYEQGGVVSAVCHGPAALVNVKLSDGTYLVAGKTVAAFTNAEEIAVKLNEIVPFMLETTLKERGANHVAAPNFQANVQVSERLVTGQNPASAKATGEAVVSVLEHHAVGAD
jgi:putative intracellular protease/amidase